MSGDVMSFPSNWWTFVQQYQFADNDEVYTNGSMLIPSFRVRQMVEHYFGGEVGKTSRYAELFGTPERAARTLSPDDMSCWWCLLHDHCKDDCLIDERGRLLEWLRGESDE